MLSVVQMKVWFTDLYSVPQKYSLQVAFPLFSIFHDAADTPTVGGWIMTPPPPQVIRILIPGTWQLPHMAKNWICQCNYIKDFEMKRLSWGALSGITCILIRGDRGRIDMRAHTRAQRWRLESCDHKPRNAGSHQVLAEARSRYSPAAWRQHSPADAMRSAQWNDFRLLASKTERIHFCFCEPPSMW